jgi:predicted transcriptional regulator
MSIRTTRLFRRKNREKFYDPETGEEMDGCLMFVQRRRTNGFGEGWIAVAQDPTDLLAHSDLDGADFKVLFKIFKKLDFENYILLNQAEIASEMGMHRQNVQRAIKNLIALGVIVEGPKFKQNRTYQLNPQLVWKGSGENHKKALKKQQEERMKAAKITGVIETKDPNQK